MGLSEQGAVSAHDVASYLIDAQHKAGRTIDKLQLQKLLYLVHGAYLVLWSRRAFREPVRAFAQGPVVENVERTYSEVALGTEPITRSVGGKPSRVSPELGEVIALVLGRFGTWTGLQLARFVKTKDSPWQLVHDPLPKGEPSHEEIPDRLTVVWFARRGIEPARPRLTKAKQMLFERAAGGDADAIAALLR